MSKPFLFIQARMGSSRLYGKVLKTINGSSVLKILVGRLKTLDLPICILTTTNKDDDEIEDSFKCFTDVLCFRGDHLNVAKRFIDAADFLKAERFFRLTGDNPFVSLELIKDINSILDNSSIDYLTFPKRATLEGTRPEYLTLSALKECYHLYCRNSYFTEHVTPILYEKANSNNRLLIPRLDFRSCESTISSSSVTLDTPDDFLSINHLLSKVSSETVKCLFNGNLDVENICYYDSTLCSLLQRRKD